MFTLYIHIYYILTFSMVRLSFVSFFFFAEFHFINNVWIASELTIVFLFICLLLNLPIKLLEGVSILIESRLVAFCNSRLIARRNSDGIIFVYF